MKKRHGSVPIGRATFLAVHLRAPCGAILESSWGSLGHLLEAFGVFWALWGVLLGSSWGLLGAVGGLSGTSGDLFGLHLLYLGLSGRIRAQHPRNQSNDYRRYALFQRGPGGMREAIK